jgi:predicted metal-dependent peptidase
MTHDSHFEKLWTRFLLKLKVQHPFFATVAMFANFRLDEQVDVSQTLDKNLLINPVFLASISEDERFSYLLHQVLHLALGHLSRGKGRNELLWNIAADISVNNIITESTSWPAAPKTAWNRRYKGDSVERIYASLQKQLSSQTQAGVGAYVDLAKKYNCQADFSTNKGADSSSQASQEYWRTSVIKAKQLNSSRQMGKGSASLEREIDLAVNGQIDWRPLLWKYATPNLVDYHEFDHRFMHAGYYTETLLSESIMVDVVVDTSGSISKGELSSFLAEMLAIYACHPDVKLCFYYADDSLYGPYDMPDNINDLPVPIGKGGTSFVPYFKELAKNKSLLERPQAIIYFTDGYGDFPKFPPPTPVLWLLTEDGLQDEKIPFGSTVRIKD